MISQFIDMFTVITITHFYAKGLPIDESQPVWPQLWVLIGSGYVFKFVVAAVDTIPLYIGVKYLSRYLNIDPMQEHEADVEELKLDNPGN